MVSGWVVVVASLAYLGSLFAIARWTESRYARRGGTRWGGAVTYALSLAIYCTSWTYYGSVGTAAATGLDFLPIYLGPTLMLLAGYPVVRKIARIARAQNTTSIADFLSNRYGKSQGLAALVTLIAVIGVLPYIALQLQAVETSFSILAGTGPEPAAGHAWWADKGLWIAIVMAAFTILFGVRTVQASEQHRGLIAAVAFESLIKLIAFLAAGVFVTWGLFGGLSDLFAQAAARPEIMARIADPIDPATWVTVTALAAFAILCLPRQFHVAFVENRNEDHLRTAMWLFPLYLVTINLFVIPIAIAGLIVIGPGGNGDAFVLALPLLAGQSALSLAIYLGGLSAATAMVIVACLALSTMVCNDLIMPLLLKLAPMRAPVGDDVSRLVLAIRRLAIPAILAASYAFYVLLGDGTALAAIGQLSFAAVAQFAPALIGGLYWRRGHRLGAILGLAAGIGLWLVLVVAPALGAPAPLPAMVVAGTVDPFVTGVLLSLACNVGLYVGVSLLARPAAIDRVQADAFVGIDRGQEDAPPLWRAQATFGDLEALAARFLGAERTARAFGRLSRGRGYRPDRTAPADPDAVRFTEALLAGAIGAPSARIVMASLMPEDALSQRETRSYLDTAMAAVKHGRDQLRTTLETIDQGIGVFDEKLTLAISNRRWLDLLGVSESMAAAGTPLAAFTDRAACGVPLDMLVDQHKDARRRHQPHHYRRQRPDGFVIEISTNPMPDGGFVATVSDITERARYEQALKEANESLESRVADRTRQLTAANQELSRAKAMADAANRSKTRFLAAASHDLLQPLNAARLFSSSLLETAARIPGDEERRGAQRPLLENLDRSLKSVEQLLDALLDISKLDAGGVVATVEQFPVHDVLNQLAVEFEAIAAEKGLRLRVRCRNCTVRSDPRLLRRLVQNFLSNAVRYTEDGGVLLTCRSRGDTVRIEVWDTGPGIPEDKRAAVFGEFQRLETADKASEKGLGLGLAIVDRIARVLDHPIGLRSRVGHGTVFAVDVPRGEGVAATVRAAGPAPRVGALTGQVILVVDNEAAILDGMDALLSGWGCTVLTATDEAGAAAALAAAAARPDLLLIDYNLDDGMTGIDLLPRLRAAVGGEVPAILITALRTEAVHEAARTAGMGLLTKPIKPAALRALISRVTTQAAPCRPAPTEFAAE